MTADVTRTNYPANSTLTSTALNADLNQILTRINDFPADKLTDATVTKDKLATGATADLTIVTKTTTATLLTTEEIVFLDTSGGAYTVTLPTAVGNSGLVLFLKKTTSDTNVATIDPNGSETIDGETTFLVARQFDSVRIISNGTNWNILEDNAPIYVYGASNGNETITASVTDITFTEVTDTHGAWSGTLFTAPRKGRYLVNAAMRWSTSANRNPVFYKNTTALVLYLTHSGLNSAYFVVTAIIDLASGDTLSIRDLNGGTLSSVKTSSVEDHWIAITNL